MHLLSLVISTLVITAIAVAQPPSTVLLNQDLLEHWWEGTERQDMTLDSSLSSEGQALRAASTTLTRTVDFNEPRSVLRLILETTGAQATVYPTERYFYYKFDLGHRRVSGNLRFTEIEDGFLHIGYFDDFMPRGAIQIGTFIDGQDISIEDGPLPNQYTVIFEDLRTVFTLNTQPFNRADELSILECENYISGILDESGHTLHLLYNTIDHMFFYVRSVSAAQPESFTNYKTPGGMDLKIGTRSRFVFYLDPETQREILVGVLNANVQSNGYFDGPFDQVPPRLDIKPLLEEAYPYIKLGSGIDAHGNFLNGLSQRVAISPYQAYDSIEKLAITLDQLYRPASDGPLRWTLLCYEWKRDYHKQLAAMEAQNGTATENRQAGKHIHNRATSQSWPANHWGDASRKWVGHTLDSSRSWTPNHKVDTSKTSTTPDVAEDPEQKTLATAVAP